MITDKIWDKITHYINSKISYVLLSVVVYNRKYFIAFCFLRLYLGSRVIQIR